MKTKLSTALVLMSLAFVPVSSQAYTVNTDNNGTNATGISGLVVDGQTYDVTFLFRSGNEVYGAAPSSTFDFDGPLAAGVAGNEVILALNSESAVITVGGFSPQNEWFIGYGYTLSQDKFNVFKGFYDAPNWGLPNNDPAALGEDSRVNYADFTAPAVVPIPAAAWLFGSGILGLVGLVRRRKTV